MNLKRILAMVLVGIMAVLCLASCGGAKTTVNVTLKINCDDPDFPIILNVPVTVEKENPTVLDAFTIGCDAAEMAYVLDDGGDSVLDIDVYKDYKDAETGITYFWYYTINGKEPTEGKASSNAIAEGDVIEYIYTTILPEEE